jgi:hypothetical protein
VRESRTPGSARGGRGNPVPYRYRSQAGWRVHVSCDDAPAGSTSDLCLDLSNAEVGGCRQRLDLVDDALLYCWTPEMSAGGISAARQSGRLAPRPTGRGSRPHAERLCGSCSYHLRRVRLFRRPR